MQIENYLKQLFSIKIFFFKYVINDFQKIKRQIVVFNRFLFANRRTIRTNKSIIENNFTLSHDYNEKSY